MKTLNIIKYGLLGLTSMACLSCSDQFLKDMKDYDGFNEEIYNDVETATAKVDYVYYNCLPSSIDGSNATEEYAGGHSFTKIKELTAKDVPDNFSGVWTKIRECNIFMDHIDKGTLSEEDKRPLKGQILFWRAWLYWSIVNQYGGVPIILTAQNAILGSGDLSESELAVPRNSTEACMERIVKDLDDAIHMLPGQWDDANWGRITSGAAAAFKGRVLLAYASPLFNRNDDPNRWQKAYDANKEAQNILTDNGFGLVDAQTERAKGWEQMFISIKSPEAVITTLYNTVTQDTYKKNNGWEQSIRPKEIEGGGGKAVTAEMVDLFPMKDGKKPGESIYPYDRLKFYKNRDPRFYRTFAFNGVVWPYKQDQEYTIWNYQWYKSEENMNSGGEGSGFAEYRGHVNTSIYLRKRSNPNADFSETDKFNRSATPNINLRYAEVVLNLAESACGVGTADAMNEAYTLLKSIRQRVGYTGDCGLDASLLSNRDKLFEAILYERLIEFAYEGKRYEDMRRWMLYNDDFGTCSRLGVEPFNGKRHHGMFLAVKPSIYTCENAGIEYDIFNPESPAYDATQTTREGIGLNIDAENDEEFEQQMQKLDKFYNDNLLRLENDIVDDNVDLDDPTRFKVTFLSKYYLIGIKQSVLQKSPYLEQTIGWTDYYGNEGTFDPLK